MSNLSIQFESQLKLIAIAVCQRKTLTANLSGFAAELANTTEIVACLNAACPDGFYVEIADEENFELVVQGLHLERINKITGKKRLFVIGANPQGLTYSRKVNNKEHRRRAYSRARYARWAEQCVTAEAVAKQYLQDLAERVRQIAQAAPAQNKADAEHQLAAGINLVRIAAACNALGISLMELTGSKSK